MPRIPLPRGREGAENLPRTKRGLRNCFNNGNDKVLPIPGIVQLSTTSRVARGNFTWNGSLYQVVTNDLIKITNLLTGAFSVIGTISGSTVIKTAVGFNDAVIVVKGGASYTLSKADVLTDTSGNANFVPFVDVTHINGRFIYVNADGLSVKFSDVGAAGTIQPLSFFDAEELPDSVNGCFNLRNTLYITGPDSIELFRDTGDTPNPFARVPGSRINNGLIGGLLEYNETFLFVGREKGQDMGIYSIAQGRGLKISNESVDLVLSTYSIDELALVIAGRFKWRGYDIATFTFGRDSFAYFGLNWDDLDTVFDGVPTTWAGGFIAQHQGKYYTAYNDKIGVISNVNTTYGERATRIIDTAFETENGEDFSIQSVEIGISQGFNSADGSVALMMSRNGIEYPKTIYKNLGEIGEYQDKIVWNLSGGLGKYEGFVAIRIYTTEDIFFGVTYMDVELAA